MKDWGTFTIDDKTCMVSQNGANWPSFGPVGTGDTAEWVSTADFTIHLKTHSDNKNGTDGNSWNANPPDASHPMQYYLKYTFDNTSTNHNNDEASTTPPSTYNQSKDGGGGNTVLVSAPSM